MNKTKIIFAVTIILIVLFIIMLTVIIKYDNNIKCDNYQCIDYNKKVCYLKNRK